VIHLDASALVKLPVEEDGSLPVREAVAGKAVRTSTIAFVEVLSAISRKADLDADERLFAIREFLSCWRRFNAVPTDPIREAAGVLTRGHRLRAFDAVHLAAALALGCTRIDHLRGLRPGSGPRCPQGRIPDPDGSPFRERWGRHVNPWRAFF